MGSLNWAADTALPISLAMVKAQLRITHAEFDELITALHIPSAVAWAEGFMHRSILAKEHTLVLDDFPRMGYQRIRLPRGKCQSVTSIVYTRNNAQSTLTGPTSGSPGGTGYRENLLDEFGGMLYPNEGTDWPDVDLAAPQPVKVTFSAGWTAATVPSDIKGALIRYVADELDVPGSQDMGNMQAWHWQAKEAALSAWRIL